MTRLPAAQLRRLSPDVRIEGDDPPPTMDHAERARQQYKPRQAQESAAQMAEERRAMSAEERQKIVYRAAITHQALPAMRAEFWQAAAPDLAEMAAQTRTILLEMLERMA